MVFKRGKLVSESLWQYVLVSPCRNEEGYLEHTLKSVCAQTKLPAQWIIVDDGSTDRTPDILLDYAGRFPWINVVGREDRGGRSVGPGVVDAFYAGWDSKTCTECAYLCKLDMDLILPPHYFEKLMQAMHDNPRLGAVSGKVCYSDPSSGRKLYEVLSDEICTGAAKFYRLECFEEIGGFVREVMWDGIDCHRCRMLGWTACSVNDPDLELMHLRPMGSSQRGILAGRYRHGFGQYFMGTSLGYITASALFRIASRPALLGSLAMWWGFVSSMIRRLPKYDNPEFRRFLRRYQRLVLLKGKRRAVEIIDAETASAWAARHGGGH